MEQESVRTGELKRQAEHDELLSRGQTGRVVANAGNRPFLNIFLWKSLRRRVEIAPADEKIVPLSGKLLAEKGKLPASVEVERRKEVEGREGREGGRWRGGKGRGRGEGKGGTETQD